MFYGTARKIQFQFSEKLSVRAGLHNQRFSDNFGLRRFNMRMSAENEVDTGNLFRKFNIFADHIFFLVRIYAAVRQADNVIDFLNFSQGFGDAFCSFEHVFKFQRRGSGCNRNGIFADKSENSKLNSLTFNDFVRLYRFVFD